ncbi:TraB/GumN family protein [Roseateles oligotrophus]|uniref:TraB/GumN family protein n=1 Tax=Roseateles oligotrophus TaxID=1769250 RepID=A0ABT2YD89_9BURK|nr:TraB/GumN family protein [Roseateles oligotrophus]MCV2368013.1 TraB/GumN family protein [Roseateles oligotrophus]
MRRWLRIYCSFLLSLGFGGPACAAACPPAPTQATAAQAAAWSRLAQDHGLLYRISRDGRDSYVYGSLHIGRPEWAYPGPKLRAALERVDVLALELDLSDAATLQVLSQPPAHAPELKLTPALRKRLDAQASAACLPAEALARQHPLMALSTYTVLAARWDGLDPSFGQETLLTLWAREHALPIIGLEDAAGQLRALIPADPKLALLALQKGLAQLEQGRVRPIMKRLAQAWAQGDLATMQDYAHWCDCVEDAQDRADFVRLNDGRNPTLAAGIEARHAQGQSVLAAVGALHLSGQQSLLKQLSQRGFVVQQLHPRPN